MRMRGGEVHFLSNRAGGVLGGISTGQDVVARFAVKPTSSILTPRQGVTIFGRGRGGGHQGPSRPLRPVSARYRWARPWSLSCSPTTCCATAPNAGRERRQKAAAFSDPGRREASLGRMADCLEEAGVMRRPAIGSVSSERPGDSNSRYRDCTGHWRDCRPDLQIERGLACRRRNPRAIIRSWQTPPLVQALPSLGAPA